MASKSFDKIDVFLSVIFLAFSFETVDLMDATLLETDLDAAYSTVAGAEMTIPFVGSLLILVFVYVTNNSYGQLRDYADEYMWTVIGTVALVLGIQFIPVIREAATSSDLAAFTVVFIQAFGYAAISYLA